MKVELFRGLGEPIVLDGVTRILVLNDQNTPIAIASEWSPGMNIAAHAGEGDQFRRVLHSLGVDRTVVAVPLKVLPNLLG